MKIIMIVILTNIYFSPNKKKRLESLHRSKLNLTKKNARANIKILRLQNELNSIRDEISKISEEKLDDMLQKEYQ
ncbi:THAP domain-containing protein 9 [Aphis craccivora]|uniref:THAP domain-containing protein 9 n=1 Tax=Aphis craccivora TaxID=307492 RepID=A0A6G0VWF2_APHCR|nr:THAP domain-containing protein 9 [Aphis craccivora]